MEYKDWKEIIDREGRTITWLAKQVGVERRFLSMQIRGKRKMKPETRKKLLQILNIIEND